MEIDLLFKTPDVVDNALEEMSLNSFGDIDARLDVREACKKWVKYGEFIKIRINTETGEAKVLPAGE